MYSYWQLSIFQEDVFILAAHYISGRCIHIGSSLYFRKMYSYWQPIIFQEDVFILAAHYISGRCIHIGSSLYFRMMYSYWQLIIFQEDVFILAAHYVGKLRKIKIGHDRPELSKYKYNLHLFDKYCRCRNFCVTLKTYAAISNAHLSCVWKQVKLSGSFF